MILNQVNNCPTLCPPAPGVSIPETWKDNPDGLYEINTNGGRSKFIKMKKLSYVMWRSLDW